MPNKPCSPSSSCVVSKAIDSIENSRYAEARNQIDSAIASDPANLQYRSVKVNMLMEIKDYHGALKELQAMETMEPDPAFLYSMESQCLICLGRNDEAVRAADKALMQDSYYLPAYSSKAFALMNMGFLNEALETYSDAVRLNPTDTESHAFLAELHLRMDNPDSAEKEAKQAINLQKDNIKANNVLVSIARSGGDIEEYIKSLIKAYANTLKEEYIIHLTTCLWDAERTDDAGKIAEKFYKLWPANIAFVNNLAHIYLLENRIDKSEKIYNDLIGMNNNSHTNIQYITFLNEAERYSEVLRKVDQLIDKYPDEEGFLYNKFYALSRTGDHRNAIIIIRKLYSLRIDSSFYAIEYSLEMAYLENFTESIRILKRMEVKYEGVDLFAALWAVYSMMNEPEMAMEYAIETMENGADDNFLISFPGEVIESFLDRGWFSYAADFIKKLIEETEGEVRDICIAYRACLLATDNYDKGREALQEIGNNEKVRYILSNILKFDNLQIKNFIKRYINENFSDK
jgi:tetratricopeptide (TPR) repeat protein